MEKRYSIEDIGIFDAQRTVNTPRSLEACKREGINPKDLVYKPLEHFAQNGLASEAQALYYSFFEDKRKQLIEIIKAARRKIIKESSRNSKSRSSTMLNTELKSTQNFERSKEKQLWLLSNALANEDQLAKDLLSRENERQTMLSWRENLIKQKSRNHKSNNDKIRAREIQRNKSQAIKLKQEKKMLGEKLKSSIDDEFIDGDIADKKAKEREMHIFMRSQKLQEHFSKMEENVAKAKEEKLKKIEAKEEREKKRQEALTGQMKALRSEIHEKQARNEKKRKEILQKLEEEAAAKKEYYEKKFKEEELRSVNFVESEKQKIQEMFKSKSQERLRKTQMAVRQIEDQFERKRQKLEEKELMIQRRFEENEEAMRQTNELKKHQELLKEFNKEWNLMREKKKEDFNKRMIRKKIKEEEKRVKKLAEQKEAQIKLNSELNTQVHRKKEKVNEVLYNISVTKKWSKRSLVNLFGNSSKLDSLKNSAYSTSRHEAPSPK